MNRWVLLLPLLLLACAPRERNANDDYAKAQKQLASAETRQDRFYALRAAGKAAVNSGHAEEAAGYADELLNLAPEFRGDWNYGNAVHDGHLIRGRLALRRGDVAAAKSELLLAGDTPGSPQLDSFGPNMSLAKELLEHNERDTVLEYFRRCERFWDSDEERLPAWRAAIGRGEMPDFGANLRY